ncbi:MAG: ribulose-phosphate 3-epimerase [Candidatus Omnitrophica bacterium]|nr:ribulose-phosphate 3-epimerase [Candidatus Omnitrophota bacterium]
MIKVSASLLSADFGRLAEDIKRVEDAGVDMLHIDVMDGHFVPNITIGPAVVKFIKKNTRLPLDVHLMIEHPQKLIDAFIQAGSDMITLHVETISVSGFRLQAAGLKKKQIKAGISLNPSTPLERIKKYLPWADFVLVMSVNPGFSGQAFIPEVAEKIIALRAQFTRDIAVDGGINAQTARQAVKAGATILAAGSAIFGAKNIAEAIERIRHA